MTKQICDGKGDPENVFVLMASALACMNQPYLINSCQTYDTSKSNIWGYNKQ